MTDLYFVDTNVLVYSRDATEPDKQPMAEAWRKELWRRGTGRLSAQVLNEYYQVVTRKLVPGMPRERARAEIQDLMQWQPLPLTPQLLFDAWGIEDRHQISLWDALIVAAGQAADCAYLLSEDLGEGRDFDGMRVINPFTTAPH